VGEEETRQKLGTFCKGKRNFHWEREKSKNPVTLRLTSSETKRAVEAARKERLSLVGGKEFDAGSSGIRRRKEWGTQIRQKRRSSEAAEHLRHLPFGVPAKRKASIQKASTQKKKA